MTIYCVCGWDNYYPDRGLGNVIKAFVDRDAAEKFLGEIVGTAEESWDMNNYHRFGGYRRDNYEICELEVVDN